MMKLLNITSPLHKKTKRDYPARMYNDKAGCMKIAKKYGQEYWDGDRKYGYGGYRYDARWEPVAKKLIDQYGLNNSSSVLDVGCGKGFLLYELKRILPGCRLAGFDISGYAISNAKEEIRPFIFQHNAQDDYPFKEKEFDLAISITTLHNFPISGLKSALKEMERVAKNKYLVVESYRNEEELFNLQCWALTCESFFSKNEWVWLFNEFGFKGDYEFIYFE